MEPRAGTNGPLGFGPMDLLGELIEHLATDLRAEDGPPGPDVVVDLHAERVQEPPQTITGQRVQVDLGLRQVCEQIRVVVPLRRRRGHVPPQLRVQPCQFVLQLDHAGAGPREKLPVGVVGSFQDAHEVVHAAADLADLPAEHRFNLLVLRSRGVRRRGQAGLDQRKPVRAEDPVVEEPGCRVDEDVLTDPDRRRMTVGNLPVTRLTVRVGDALLARVAVHPALAGFAPHVRPQLVQALGLPMWVQGHRVEVRTVLRPARDDPSNLDEVLGGEEGFNADQGGVFRLAGDDPFVLGVLLAG